MLSTSLFSLLMALLILHFWRVTEVKGQGEIANSLLRG